MSSTSSFCSNPDALGIDESEKGIFYSLKNIAQLPLGSPKEGDRLADSAASAAGDLPIGEAGKESPATGTGECLDAIDWFFRWTFLLISLYFSDKPAEDQPKSPTAAKVGLVPLESSQQEVEKPVGESTAVAQGILGCHSALIVSNFLYSSTFVGLSSTLS